MGDQADEFDRQIVSIQNLPTLIGIRSSEKLIGIFLKCEIDKYIT